MKSWIDVSAPCLQANFAAVQAAAPGAEVLCVLKADAYGHGARLCAPALVEAGARWLGVADLEEGLAVREALAETDLPARDVRTVVMCGFEPGDARALVEGQLTPVIWTAEHIGALGMAAALTGREVAVHLEVDSGMARQGAKPGAELLAVLEALRDSAAVRLEGVFSHLSCSEVVDAGETERQKRRFAQALEEVDAFEDLRLPEFLHFDNSSAVDGGATVDWMAKRLTQRTGRAQRYATGGEAMRRLVRPGLALYGCTLPLLGAAASGAHLALSLQPVATWKTRITGLREIVAGDTVGYGATFTATHPMRLALLPVGYADGFRREASSGMGDGWVMIRGRRAPVVGRVSMNLLVVDVTGHGRQPAVGDEAVLLGDEAVLLGEGVTAHDHARWAGTIPYEILCGMRGHRRLVA